MLASKRVTLVIVCHSARKDDDSVGIEFEREPMLNEDERVFVYPISSLQEEFREYSVIARIQESVFMP